jgi:hypothetical protein
VKSQRHEFGAVFQENQLKPQSAFEFYGLQLPRQNESIPLHRVAVGTPFREFPCPDEELARLVARRGQIYTAWPMDKRPRLSLAGAQNKCPVLIRDGSYLLPEGEALPWPSETGGLC